MRQVKLNLQEPDREGVACPREAASWLRQSSLRGLTLLLLGVAFAGFFAFGQSTAAVSEAVSEWRAGRTEAAMKTIDAGLRADAANFKLWSLKGVLLDQQGNAKEAAGDFERALKLSANYLPALDGLAQIRYRESDPSASSLLEHILRIEPQDIASHTMLGELAFRQGNCKVAVDHFRSAGVVTSDRKDLLQENGFCLVQEQRYAEALTVFKVLLKREPADGSARYNVALTQYLADAVTDAEQTLADLCSSDPCDTEILTLSADIAEAQGKVPQAVELLRRVIQQDPADPEGYLRFAALANENGSFSTGITMLDVGLGALPGSAPLYLARGALYSQLADYERAVADFARANELDPQLAAVDSAKGVMQTQQKNSGDALATFRQAAKRKPDDALSQFLLAEALFDQSAGTDADRKEQIAVAKRAAALDPTMTQAHDLLAALYLQTGQTAFAARECDLALRQNPEDQQAVYHLILALRKGDRKQEIPALVKKLVELRDADAQTHPRFRLSAPAPAAPANHR